MSGAEPPPAPVTFRHAAFADLGLQALHDLLRLRQDVFVLEQGIHRVPDLDGLDPLAVHVLGTVPGGALVATARVIRTTSPAQVGRVVVRAHLRGRGVGTACMEHVHAVLRGAPAEAHAQAHLEAWYRRLGWVRKGPVYEEGGVPHVTVVREAGAEG